MKGRIYQLDKKERLEKLSSDLAQITQKFSEQVLDATNAWQLVVRDETKLKGLPETAKDAARLTAIEKLGKEEGKNAWVSYSTSPLADASTSVFR